MSTNSDRTAITYATVQGAAFDVRETAKILQDGLETLMTKVKRVAETWEGEAKTAYHDIQTQNDKQMTEMTDKLRYIAQLLDDSVVGYQSTDLDAANRLRRLGG
ncbi:hypothetical protein SGFS_038220 [Streptomyces graminofaciens]|uniref:ESAT-6-like protein n=1 Tax=Streptomyces graminofaciens TaxID=68212 RepID=A0ABN5VGR2_9ACTN|nr:WXG100 family type VII secretion target [Streptomyces graminofaciens]BBC32528.1 hypothetical protein SGFS_038220 [Streptomyces graminofaciens]